ncbi:trimeric intracellular cation channel family protein [Martelella soudanensis]|uniref:trimeric intracellular cation channel family protein n=1 Tax=unclassified Martelella TaxID=2629616 RepID=UPI0015DE3A5E|nr:MULTISPECIES: trimeric intracellular cation channel family protein [unclassified Martelella]
MITDPTTLYLLHIIYLVALAAEAMTAALAAGRRSMDWVGVILLACITGLGGGSVRDLLLDHHPLSWVGSPELLLVTGGAAILTIIIARHMHRLQRVFLFLDAVGLVVFSIIGSNIAIGLDQPFLVVIAAGMITGCVGGVLRDILCNDVPLLFRAELYATVSVITVAIFAGGGRLGLDHNLVLLLALSAGLCLRLLALRFGWSMPKFVYKHDLH